MAAPAPNYRAIAVQAATRAGINPAIFLRQINQESGFNPNARSGAGAVGIAQIVPRWHPGVHATDPVASLNYAAKLMSSLVQKYGNYQQALSVYNSGNPEGYKSIGQTAHYVQSIMGGANVPVPAGAPASLRVPKGGGAALAGTFSPALLSAMRFTDSLLGLPAFQPPAALQAPAAGVAAAPVGARIPYAPGGKAGGFLPPSAAYTPGRLDAGHDFQTNPGGALFAPGDGYVIRLGFDPHGFGPRYPIVHFTSGPYRGKNLYLGHTLATVQPGQRFRAGQVLSRTGTSPVGNASVPGWAEIGFAPGGTPGEFGQTAPF
jgi:hypothetical protein